MREWLNEWGGWSECPRRRRPTGGTEPMSMRRRLLHHHRTHHSVIWYCERDVLVRRFRREDGKKKLQYESKRSHRVLLEKLAGCSWWWPHLSSQHLSQLICNLQIVIEWPLPTKVSSSFNIRRGVDWEPSESSKICMLEENLIFFQRCWAHLHLWQQCDYWNVKGAHWAKSIFRKR